MFHLVKLNQAVFFLAIALILANCKTTATTQRKTIGGGVSETTNNSSDPIISSAGEGDVLGDGSTGSSPTADSTTDTSDDDTTTDSTSDDATETEKTDGETEDNDDDKDEDEDKDKEDEISEADLQKVWLFQKNNDYRLSTDLVTPTGEGYEPKIIKGDTNHQYSILKEGGEGRYAIYSCREKLGKDSHGKYKYDYFYSKDADCEGKHSAEGLVGYAYSDSTKGKPIYRGSKNVSSFGHHHKPDPDRVELVNKAFLEDNDYSVGEIIGYTAELPGE